MMGEMTHVSLLREGEPPPCRAQPSVRSAPAARGPLQLRLLSSACWERQDVTWKPCAFLGAQTQV